MSLGIPRGEHVDPDRLDPKNSSIFIMLFGENDNYQVGVIFILDERA